MVETPLGSAAVLLRPSDVLLKTNVPASPAATDKSTVVLAPSAQTTAGKSTMNQGVEVSGVVQLCDRSEPSQLLTGSTAKGIKRS